MMIDQNIVYPLTMEDILNAKQIEISIVGPEKIVYKFINLRENEIGRDYIFKFDECGGYYTTTSLGEWCNINYGYWSNMLLRLTHLCNKGDFKLIKL